MASAMPASPQLISSLTRHISRPVGSAKHWAMKSKEYRPFLAASWMMGHGVSSRSSHSAPAGRTTVSANSWTHFWIWSWSSFSSREKSDMWPSLGGTQRRRVLIGGWIRSLRRVASGPQPGRSYYIVTYEAGSRLDLGPAIAAARWAFSRAAPAGYGRIQRRMAVPAGVSSTVHPRAVSSSRRASARAKSLAARASSRCATSAAEASSTSLRLALERQPQGRGQHRGGAGQHLGPSTVARVGRGVGGGDQLEDAGQGARRIEVVVHVGPEVAPRASASRPVAGAVPSTTKPSAVWASSPLTGKRRARPSSRASALLGIGHGRRRHLNGRSVVGPQDQEPVGPGVGSSQHVGQRGEVAQGLGHLGALDLDPAVVHPVLGERLAVGHRLGPLVLVVGEGQVLATRRGGRTPRRAGRAT